MHRCTVYYVYLFWLDRVEQIAPTPQVSGCAVGCIESFLLERGVDCGLLGRGGKPVRIE